MAARIAFASALFGLFITGGAIMVGLYALSKQLDTRAADELRGKRDLLVHIVSEMASPESIEQYRHRFKDLLIGHDDLHLALVDPARQQVMASFSDIATESVAALDGSDINAPSILDWRAALNQRLYAIRGESVVSDGKPVRYYLSLNRRHDSRLLSGFITTTLFALPVLLLVVALGAWLIARASLTPLRRFHGLAASIGSQSLSHRLSLSGLPDELIELAEEFNRMLERIDSGYKRLHEFSGELAHEMRTPVATLLGRTQVALSQLRTVAELREVLEGNVEELERLSRLISDMLFIASADDNENLLKREPIHLDRETQQVVEYLSLIAEDKKLAIDVSGAATVTGDRLLVQRAITNLLSNAIRHARAETTVNVLIAIQSQNITLTVTNEGEGIAALHLEHIFDRFYRIDSARTRHDGGAGLGLAIVRSIMSAHGGQVYAQSVAGGLTTFTLSFPVTMNSAVNH